MTKTDVLVTPQKEFPFYAADTILPNEVKKHGVRIIYPYPKDVQWDTKSATWLVDVKTHEPSNLSIGDQIVIVAPQGQSFNGSGRRSGYWTESNFAFTTGSVLAFFRVQGKISSRWERRVCVEGTFCVLWNEDCEGGFLRGMEKDFMDFWSLSKRVGLFWVGCLKRVEKPE